MVAKKVWQYNLVQEFNNIHDLLPCFPIVSLDTEFPGNIYKTLNRSDPIEVYQVMKLNVEATKIIQLGLTLSHPTGTMHQSWEFNFKDFDCDRDLQNPDSIALLRRQGIDFYKNKAMGIDSRQFADLFIASGILGHGEDRYRRVWITFHGLYDFGYLIKILTRDKLPDKIDDFVEMVRRYFGGRLYDLKSVMESRGFRGGLEKLAAMVKVERVSGESHQAGSDSLLTMRIYWMIIWIVKGCEMEMEWENVWREFDHRMYGICPAA